MLGNALFFIRELAKPAESVRAMTKGVRILSPIPDESECIVNCWWLVFLATVVINVCQQLVKLSVVVVWCYAIDGYRKFSTLRLFILLVCTFT